MQTRPYLILDRNFTLRKRYFIPTELIEKYQFVQFRKPARTFLSLIQEETLDATASSQIEDDGWIYKIAFDASAESYHIELEPKAEVPSMKELDKYKLLVEAADDIIYETNMQGEFTYVNPKAVLVTGYKKEELIGKKYLDLIREDWRERVRAFYRNQFSETIKTTYMELPLTLKNGQILWVGQNVQLLESEHGVFGTMAIARDISARHEVQAALEVSEEKYRSIIQNLQFGLMEVDLNGDIVFVNDSMLSLTGYSRNELIGRNAEEVFLDDHQKRVINDEHGKRVKGIPSAYELRLRAKNGEFRWALISGAPKFDIHGEITGSIGIHVDITERKLNEQELFATKAKLDKYKLGAESINEISSNRKLSYDDQINEGLKIAAHYLEMPIAILSEVDEDDYVLKDYYLMEPIEGFNKGDRYNLAETYCDLTIQNLGKLAIREWSKSKYSDHQCFKMFGFESYIGSAYYVHGELKGTINFSKSEPRKEEFDLYDLEFIELLSKWIGFLITQKETLGTLREEQDKLKDQNLQLQEKEEYLTAINDFVTKLLDNETIEGVAWEIAENVIDRFGFEDCVIYILNHETACLEQLAAYGPKKAKDRKIVDPISIPLGKGVVGHVAKTGKAEIVKDASKDSRYIKDDEYRLSEISVPIVADGEVIGVIDSEHPKRNFFNSSHLGTLQTIANLAANRIKHALAKEDQLKAEEEVKASELKLRKILHSAIDGVISINEKGIVTEWNKQAELIFGYTATEIIGKTLQETIIPHNFRKQHTQGMSHYMDTGEGPVLNQKIEISALRKNGEEFPIELAIIPVFTKGEHSFTAFVSDITVQRRVQDEMEKALQKERELNELKSRFVSMTSHEFRTPLTTIKQNIDLISFRLENKLPEQAADFAKYINRVESEIKRVTDLMNDILMLGRIDAGKVSMKLKEVDLVQYVKDSIAKLTESRSDGRSVKMGVFGVPRRANIDVTLFNHIMSNLVSNALKYSEGERDPELGLHFNELKTYRISIKDYGIGIPEKDQKSLFQSFYRATNVKNIQGSGLGLSIVKEFTQMHGGDITIKSKPGEGTEFILDIPYN